MSERRMGGDYSNLELYNIHRKFDESMRLKRLKRQGKDITAYKNNFPGYSIPKYVMIEVIVKNIQDYGTLTCEYCKKILNSRNIHFEHIIPRTKGGKGTVDNVNISCISCNHLKRDKDLDIFLEQLKIKQEKSYV